MKKTSIIIRELTRLAESGYQLTREEKNKLTHIVMSMSAAERNILLGRLVGRLANLEETGEWTDLADEAMASISLGIPPRPNWISKLEEPFDLPDPINDYNIPLEKDFTVAGELYKGSDKYFELLQYFNSTILVNIYLSHYPSGDRSLGVFYNIVSQISELFACNYFLKALFLEGFSPERAIEFVTRMKRARVQYFEKPQSEMLGSFLLNYVIDELEHGVTILEQQRLFNPILHIVYFLGVDTSKIEDIAYYHADACKKLLLNFEMFQVIYMKYKDRIAYSSGMIVSQHPSNIIPFHGGIVDEEAHELLDQYKELKRIRSE